MNVVPPDVGAVHQVNLEQLCRVVHVSDGLVYPDSVVGTDSHTTMINGLGVLGWGKPHRRYTTSQPKRKYQDGSGLSVLLIANGLPYCTTIYYMSHCRGH